MTSSPANRTALREEENRSAPASQQVIASAVTGPTPYSRAASTFAPVRCRAASSQLVPQLVHPGLQHLESSPARWRPAAARPGTATRRPRPSAARLRPARCEVCPRPGPGRPGGTAPRGSAAPRRCARPAGRDTAPAAPGLPGCGLGGIQHSGSRPSASSIRRCRQSVLSVLACRLRPRANAVSAGSARCAAIPAAASSSATYRHPIHPYYRQTLHHRNQRTGPATPVIL